MAKRGEEFVGVLDRVKWRSEDRTCIIAVCECKTAVVMKQVSETTELVPGMTYRFLGQFDVHHTHGRQFNALQFQIREPNSRHGLVKYLERYAPNIGPAIASQLYDAFGSDAVKQLRTDPDAAAAACRSLSAEKARESAKALQALVKLEETKIALMNLFAGRGFPNSLVDDCIGKWGILAPDRVRRDPFTLLVHDLAGAGFARCDRLYADLGLPMQRLKRQVICLWNELQADMSGHTWFRLDEAVRRLGELVGGVKVQPNKALRLGVRSGWLAVRQDSAGVWWLASGKHAADEQYLADRVGELMEGAIDAVALA